MDILRILRDNLEPGFGCLQLIHEPHPHMSVHHRRVTLGMVRDEIERNWFSIRSALVVQAMLQEVIKKQAGSLGVRTRACRSPHNCIRQRRSNPGYSIVVKP